jgi:hypothetical protein
MSTVTPAGSAVRTFFGRRNWPLFGVLLLLALLLIVSALRSQPGTPVAFDLDSSADNGLRGFTLWLERLGYQVHRTDGLRFVLPADADLFFVYPNQLSYTADEAAELRTWVEQGKTLVIVGPHPEDDELERVFGVRASQQEGFSMLEKQVQPLVPHGTQDYLVDWSVDASVLDLSNAPTAVPVLATAGGEVSIAVQPVGAGVVWHLTPGNGFLNHGLQTQGHGDFLPPILRTVPHAGTVAFDTFHQFGMSRVGERIATLQDWLYRTPAGWATLFAATVLALFLVLQGRRLGPPVPAATELRRREAAEYVQAMAALARRAHLGGDVARHQQQRLKRGLARRRTMSPDLPDDDFLERLGSAQPPIAPARLANLGATLHALSKQPREHQLVELSAKVDQILREEREYL